MPEGRRIFSPLTVRENLMVGANSRLDKQEMKKPGRSSPCSPLLKEHLERRGGHLYRLAMDRALMSRPKLFKLGKPSLSPAPVVHEAMSDVLLRLNEARGMTIQRVEQNAGPALEMSGRTCLPATSQRALEGKGEDLLGDPRGQASDSGITHRPALCPARPLNDLPIVRGSHKKP